MNVCVYIYIYIYIYVCVVCVCVFPYIYIYMYVCFHLCMSTIHVLFNFGLILSIKFFYFI